MNADQDITSNVRPLGKSDPGQVVLVLQGGGALGSYQAGVYQALHEAGIEPDWIIGTSIGAINASLIAGNAPQNRLSRLREFWKRMEQNPVWSFRDIFPGFNEKLVLLVDGDQRHSRVLPAQPAGACRRCTIRSAPTMPATIRPRRWSGRSPISSISTCSIAASRG